MCLVLILSLISCQFTENQDDLSSNENTDSSDSNHDSTNDLSSNENTGSSDLNNDSTSDNNTILAYENEIAMKTYEAAINDEICVVDESLREINLKDCRFPSDNLRLGECEILYKAILDMDGDGINEYIIQSEAKDHIVLHYHDGKVYSYCFDSKSFFNLNTDGSFYWIDSYEIDNCTREEP